MDDEFKRITIRSLKDTQSGAYSVADYDRDVKAIERALKSALPEKAFYHKSKDINYNDPTFHQIGKLKEDFYIKSSYTSVAQQAIDQVLEKMHYTKSDDPKYWSTRSRPLSDKESSMLKELEAMDKKKEEKRNETDRFNKGTMLKILGTLVTVADVARRILSSVLNIATQQVKDTVEAHNLGISREQLRNYNRLETVHSLKEGTISGAISDIQNKFGNITALDENALQALAVVMGGKIEEMATMGLGASNPEKILESILDTFNERANAGVNSIGQYVGEAQARRELYSYLLKVSPQVADIFATMQEEQHNINSIYRNQAETFAQWKETAKTQRGTTQAGEGVLYTLGEEWNVFKQLLEDIKHSLAVSLAPTLTRILRRLNNMRVGMSESEKLRVNAENRDANAKALRETEASIAFLEQKSGGDISKLSKSEKAYYETLVEYRDKLEKENTKPEIDNIVMTPNEIKAEQEHRLRTQAKSLSYLITNTNSLTKLEADDPIIRSMSFTDSEIMNVINSQGDSIYGANAYKSFVAKRKAELRKTNRNMSEEQLEGLARKGALQDFARQYYRFFYPKLLNVQADNIISQSYNDQIYDIDRAREQWGANFEGLANALPKEALGTHKLISVDVNENGVIVHKLVLDINDSNGVNKGDFVIAEWTGNDRGGATGTQTEMTWDKQNGITVNSLGTSASQTKK